VVESREGHAVRIGENRNSQKIICKKTGWADLGVKGMIILDLNIVWCVLYSRGTEYGTVACLS
jgi:hypothetical protein